MTLDESFSRSKVHTVVFASRLTTDHAQSGEQQQQNKKADHAQDSKNKKAI